MCLPVPDVDSWRQGWVWAGSFAAQFQFGIWGVKLKNLSDLLYV